MDLEIIRNNDYIHDELGIIIEDLHDEKVLTQNGLLYFIDTFFLHHSCFFVAKSDHPITSTLPKAERSWLKKLFGSE